MILLLLLSYRALKNCSRWVMFAHEAVIIVKDVCSGVSVPILQLSPMFMSCLSPAAHQQVLTNKLQSARRKRKGCRWMTLLIITMAHTDNSLKWHVIPLAVFVRIWLWEYRSSPLHDLSSACTMSSYHHIPWNKAWQFPPTGQEYHTVRMAAVNGKVYLLYDKDFSSPHV